MQQLRTAALQRIKKARKHAQSAFSEKKNAGLAKRKYRQRLFLHGEQISQNAIRKTMTRWEERLAEKTGERRRIETYDQLIFKKNGGHYQTNATQTAEELLKKQLIAHARKKGINDNAISTLSRTLTSSGRKIPGTSIEIKQPTNAAIIKLINQLGLEKTKRLFTDFQGIGAQLKTNSSKVTKSAAFLNAASQGPHFYIATMLQYKNKEQLAQSALKAIRERAKDIAKVRQSKIENKEHYARQIWEQVREEIKELEKYCKTNKVTPE